MPFATTPHSVCRFGVARCDVTPPVGIYHRMWGAATHEQATGVHRPLTATALVFESATGAGPNGEVVLLAVDHCLLWAAEQHDLVASVSRQTGVPAERFLVAYSHTHAAGLMDRSRVHLPGGALIPPYLDELANRLADITRQARAALQPATLTYGHGRCSMAGHRDFFDPATKQIVCGYNPDGPADDTVLVGRITSADGRTLATLVNYACHPTTLAWQNTLISPDFPGAMREIVEGATGAPCVFLQGASGDLGPREGFVGDQAVADRNGRQLGHAVLATLESLPAPLTRFEYTGAVVAGATLGTWAHVPLEAAARTAKSRWRLRRWTLPLPYRPELPNREETLKDRAHWLAEEQAAQAAGDAGRARDCHAMVERKDRELRRIAALPAGDEFPFPITVWQMGDAFWVAVEGEHYQHLQRRLRAQFGDVPVVVMTLVNGAVSAYLPDANSYGKGIYQETIAVLAPGSLERLTEELARQIGGWQEAAGH